MPPAHLNFRVSWIDMNARIIRPEMSTARIHLETVPNI